MDLSIHFMWQATEPETVIALAGLLAQHTPVKLGAQVTFSCVSNVSSLSHALIARW